MRKTEIDASWIDDEFVVCRLKVNVLARYTGEEYQNVTKNLAPFMSNSQIVQFKCVRIFCVSKVCAMLHVYVGL